MPHSRAATARQSLVSSDTVRALCADVLRPAHFFLASELTLEKEHAVAEEDAWEIFQGRLLDRPFTREKQSFIVWNVFLVEGNERSGEPLLSLKLDDSKSELHVVRGVHAYVHEGYDAGGGVYQTREYRRWIRELSGTVHLEDFTSIEELRDELVCRLFRSVVGASRLPLHSVEAPLPAFSFGKLFYCYRPDAPREAGPIRNADELIDLLSLAKSRIECAKLLEIYLRAVPNIGDIPWLTSGLSGDDLIRLLQTLFNEVSLSPWTDFVGRTLAFLTAREDQGVLSEGQITDFLAHLLRQTGRHLTAYDLVLFHHRGANYPDALLLDAVIKVYLTHINRQPSAFKTASTDDEATKKRKQMRRRALRQGWLLRCRYEGHAVPDVPTSPGEHARVLPPEYPRVPEEQLLQTAKRKRCLYADDPLWKYLGMQGESMLRESIADLCHTMELRELGLALYLDRPLGDAKAPAEPDTTLLLTSEAFSLTIAASRLVLLTQQGLLSEENRLELISRLREPEVNGGLPLETIGAPRRPGTVALTDARMAASDFIFQRTMPGSVQSLLKMFDFDSLQKRFDIGWLTDGKVLIARSPAGNTLLVYDKAWRPRLELAMSQSGYTSRGGVEFPKDGLLVMRVWTEEKEGLHEHDLREAAIRLVPQSISCRKNGKRI